MYSTNLERNKAIYELWEKNLTVDQISSRTGIPRSTVGYYARKFNRLGAEGKPAVFPASLKAATLSTTSLAQEIISAGQQMAIDTFKVKCMKMLRDGLYDQLYYMLMDWKMLKELGLLLTSEDYDKARQLFFATR